MRTLKPTWRSKTTMVRSPHTPQYPWDLKSCTLVPGHREPRVYSSSQMVSPSQAHTHTRASTHTHTHTRNHTHMRACTHRTLSVLIVWLSSLIPFGPSFPHTVNIYTKPLYDDPPPMSLPWGTSLSSYLSPFPASLNECCFTGT